MRADKLFQGVEDLRSIWSRYPARIYLESKKRKAETDSLWATFTNAERLEVIHEAYSD